jgi:hypothetical protein
MCLVKIVEILLIHQVGKLRSWCRPRVVGCNRRLNTKYCKLHVLWSIISFEIRLGTLV